MKKLLTFAFISILSVAVFSACVPVPADNEVVYSTEIEEMVVIDATETEIQQTSNAVLSLLKDKDLEVLADYIHPEKGVRFSPYATIDVENDVVIMVEELNETDEIHLWGIQDGSGEPIKMTFADYLDKFVYDQDFENAERIAVDEIIGTGNSISNVQKIYTSGTFVEYHFSGFDEEYGGMDWVSLRLVFEEYDGELKLVGVIHDQWTI